MAFVLWMLGWPLLYELASKWKKAEVKPSRFVGVAALLHIVTCVWVAVLIWGKI